jgi:hypothetical protein
MVNLTLTGQTGGKTRASIRSAWTLQAPFLQIE